jgi:outer membrane immunogenic protein
VNNPPTLDHCRSPTIVSDFATGGVIYGGTDGCNYRSGNVVVGIEYDMSWTNKSGSAFDLQPFDPNAPNTTNENCVNTLCARAGMTQDRWLSYVGASGALAGTNVSLCNTLGCASHSATRLGRTVGAGLTRWSGMDAKGRVSLPVDYGTTTYFNPAVTLPEGFTVVTRDLAIFDSIARAGHQL